MKITFRCLPELEAILPRPRPATRGMPDWIKSMPMETFSADLGEDIQTVKQCPPFIDAMTAGFLVPLACDLRVSGGTFEWDWPEFPDTVPAHTARAPIAFHLNDQVTGSPFHDGDTVAIKFVNFWTFALEAGTSLLCTHPANRYDLPFRAFTGLVDADLYADNYTHFPALWVDADFEGVLPKGTPVAQCIPVPRAGLALDYAYEALEGEVSERLGRTIREVQTPDGKYRKQFRAKKR